MKIAICLSGQPRAWKSAQASFTEFVESIKKNHQGCVIDTFIHAWDFNTTTNIQMGSPAVNAYLTDIYRKSSIHISNDEMQSLLEFYQPKKYLIEDIDKSMKIVYDAMCGDTPAPVGWSASQFYSMQRVALLKRDYELQMGEEYDWCIRYRFDLDMNNQTEFNISTLSNFDKWRNIPLGSNIYLERKYTHPTNTMYSVHTGMDINWPFYRVGDICFIADSLTYDLICNFYDWLLCIPRTLFFHGVLPEVVFCYYINMLKIDIAKLYVDPGVLRDY